MKSLGKVWLVGAGPGDPGLLTQSGKAAIDAADTVIYDRLVSEAILWDIPPNVRRINVGKGPLEHSVSQEAINRLMAAEAQEGKQVVRLKGGDPFLFGRGGEEMLFLASEGIPFEVIPGVSSALAVPAAAGIPVTHRGISAGVHIITWRGKDGEAPARETLRGAALAGVTVVILMGAAGIRLDMGQRLMEAGFDPETPASVISCGTTPRQQVWFGLLKELARSFPDQPRSPALVVLGAVCSLGETVSQCAVGEHSLRGIRIVVTRPDPRNRELCRKIRFMGGEAIPFPCIKTLPSGGIQDQDCLEAGQYQWLIFTSAAGAEIFFDRYIRGGGDFRSLGECRFAALGPATAEALRKRGFIPDVIPACYQGRSLGERLAGNIAFREKVLVICPETHSPGLFETLEKSNISFDTLPVYKTLAQAEETAARCVIENRCFDFVFFTSPSAAAAFAEAFPAPDFSHITALCIGESTASRARALGMAVYTAEEASVDSMCRLAGELPAHARTHAPACFYGG